MEFEKYEDVIDAFERGVGVEPGDTLTDYIEKIILKSQTQCLIMNNQE